MKIIEEQNPIMEKSLIHYNYLAAKKKATQEEDIKLEIPQIPKYESPKVVKDKVWWKTFFKELVV